MSNPTGKTAQGPLPAETIEKLAAVTRGRPLEGLFEGVGESAMLRALAGQPVRPATAKLIEIGLAKLAAERSAT